MILYISHMLEVVEKVCAHVIIIYRGRIIAADSVERLRDLMQALARRDLLATDRTAGPGERGERYRFGDRQVAPASIRHWRILVG
jgi:ABC-type multidrug transport system ATPase subunit